jgi:hypothetical protein
MNPSFAFLTSGGSSLATGALSVAELLLLAPGLVAGPVLQPWAKREVAVAAPAVMMNCRLENFVIADL